MQAATVDESSQLVQAHLGGIQHRLDLLEIPLHTQSEGYTCMLKYTVNICSYVHLDTQTHLGAGKVTCC